MTSHRTSSKRRLKSGLSRFMDRLLQGTWNHFSCYLPGPPGLLAGLMLRLFYSGIRMERTQTDHLDTLPEDAIVIYVSKFKSTFEYLFYNTRYRQMGYRYPEIGFDYRIFLLQPFSRVLRILLAQTIHFLRHFERLDPYRSGFFEQALSDNHTAFLSLVDEKGFYKRFIKQKTDPIRFLIELQKSSPRPVILLPQLMFFSNKPPRSIPAMVDILFGSSARPGKLRRLVMLFRSPERAFTEISEPINLKERIRDGRDPARQALLLRRDLLLQFNRHRQSITGPVLKTRAELKERILTGDRMKAFMESHAQKDNIPIYQVRKKADAYLEEIAAKYSLFVIKCFATVLSWIIDTIFEGINLDTRGLEQVKRASKRGPVILLPCHKSHIDYLMLSYSMFRHNMPCPHIVAGKNLSFWPMGPIFRNAGAFFMRRTFKGALLYATVFSEYVHRLLEEGFNIEVFIEGGRSRTGKLLRPKLGFLSILMDAYCRGACKEMVFVPIYIGYDRVPEEGAYLRELEGGKKEPESLRQMLKARRVLKKRFGKIYMNFDAPFFLSDMVREQGVHPPTMPPDERRHLIAEVANKALNCIDTISVVTPHSLVASALLNTTRRRISGADILDRVKNYINYLNNQQVQLSDTLLTDYENTVRQVISIYSSRKFIERISTGSEAEGEDEIFHVQENRRPVLEYYKNNCLVFFVPAALTALAILARDAFQFTSRDLHAGYRDLQDFFTNEFARDRGMTSEYHVRKTLKVFIDDAVIMPHASLPDTYNLTSAGYRLLRHYAIFLKSYLESYRIVLQWFQHARKQPRDPKDRLRKIQSFGSKMYRREEIELKEALSKISYINAVDFFMDRGVGSPDDAAIRQQYADFIERHLKILQS